LRQALDQAGGSAKLLVLALDGSFCTPNVCTSLTLQAETAVHIRELATLVWMPTEILYKPIVFIYIVG
jgi:hypothetical protein